MIKREINKKFQEKYSRALVTGGAGFIGSHIVKRLLELGLEVICVDSLVAGKIENIIEFKDNPNFKFEKCDITDYDNLSKLFNDVDIVFNQAASKKNVCLIDPRIDLKVNGEGTFNILVLSEINNVKKVVHASTGSVYGEAQVIPQDEKHPLCPVSYYGVSKLAGERYVKTFEHLYGLDTTILRYFHVYGPKQESGEFGGVIAIFARNILEGKNPKIFGDGSQERSFTYVDDVVDANILVATKEETKGEVYNCASGINITIEEVCHEMLKQMDSNKVLKPEYEDWLVGDIKKFDISNKKISELGASFKTNFAEGLDNTIAYYKEVLKHRD